MLLRYLPDELLILVGEALDDEAGLNAFVQTCRHLYNLLNVYLYRYNVQRSGSWALGWAAHHGRTTTAQKLLKQGADVQVELSAGRTPLYTATGNGHDEMVKLLLATGKADPTLRDEDMEGTPLCQAATDGSVNIVKMLLAADGVDPDDGDPEGTPLSWAAVRGHTEVVELLLSTGNVDPDFRDPRGRSPLWWAAEYGHEEVVKLLLAVDAVDPESRGLADDEDTDIGPPLLRAAVNGHDRIIELLLASGRVDLDASGTGDMTALWLTAAAGQTAAAKQLIATGRVDMKAKDYRDTLYVAALKGHVDMARLLLENGAPVNSAYSAHECTALQAASQAGWVEVVQLLLQCGASVDQQTTDGCTALHLASEGGHFEVARLLLQHEAPIETLNKTLSTPLHDAVSNNHLDVVQLLLRHGADIESRAGSSGSTPLHIAAQRRLDGMVRFILDQEAQINAVDRDQWSAIPCESCPVDPVAVRQSWDRRPDINLEDSLGGTPLIYASNGALMECVHELLSRSARIRTSKEYSRILQMAACCGAMNVIQQLEERKGDFSSYDDDRLGFLEALQLACLHGHTDVARRLLQPDTDPRRTDEHGWTLLYSLSMSDGEIKPQDILPGTDLSSPWEPAPFEPTCWGERDKSPFLVLGENGTRVDYIQTESQTEEVWPCSVRANHPITLHSGSYYFEVKILNGDNCEIGIGLCHGHTSVHSFPGWEPFTWGYHSDDGNFYILEESNEYGPTFGTGDVVGCLVDFYEGLTFYKNGDSLGTATSNIAGKLYPMVGMRTYGAAVQRNSPHIHECCAEQP